MLLREILLRNVGLYAGMQTFRLSTDPERPITLVGGRNGSGKTTLLEAIPLALYGIRARGILGARSYGRHLDGLIYDGASNASVTLIFDRRVDGRDGTYIVDRSWRRSAASGQAHDTLTVNVDGVPRPDLVAVWAEYVERILPLSLSGLAMFDGEKIERLADVGSAAEVLRMSLYGLLGLDLVEQLRTDLIEFRRKRARSTSGDTAAAARLHSELDDAESRLTDAKARHAELLDELEAASIAERDARHTLSETQDSLSKAGGDLFARRQELHDRRGDLREARAVAANEVRELVRGDLPLVLVGELVQRVGDVGTAAETASNARMLLAQMKARDVRIMERLATVPALTEEQLAVVHATLEDDRAGYERDHYVPFAVSSVAAGTAAVMSHAGLEDLRRSASGLLDRLHAVDYELLQVEIALKRVPDEQAVAGLVAEVSSAEQALTRATVARTRLEEETAKAGRLVEQLEVKVDDAAQRLIGIGATAANEVRVAREVERANSALEAFKARIVAKNMGRIRETVLESFQTLIRKTSLITDLSIDPDTLAISLVGGRGQHLDPDRLSAGERQTLATALLWGMAKSTGRTLPTIIDTPVGRLDSSHRHNLVTRYFPNASRQVVLLSTDEEIVGPYHEAITGSVGATYLLDYDPEANATTVREGYFA
jgi:DNA sulfur modification protein DndD